VPCSRDCLTEPGVARQRAFLDDVLARVRSVPGVLEAEATTNLPMATDAWLGMSVEIEGRPYQPGVYASSTLERRVTPGYLQMMGIQSVSGRTLSSSDARSTPRVAVINETMARRHWAGADPIGKRFKEVWRPDWITVVGVVRDVKYDGPAGAVNEEIYLPFEQQPARDMSVVIRTSLDPVTVARSMRRAVASVDDSVPVSDIRTIDEIVHGSIAQPRFTALLLASFAVMALALAAIGIYGVLSYAVGMRTREIGVRIALGARRLDVLRMVVRQAMRLVYIGTALGLTGALVASRAIEGLLFNVSPLDVRTFVVVPMVLIAVGLVAACVPASRATRIDPGEALMRGE
jgi:predicted permease